MDWRRIAQNSRFAFIFSKEHKQLSGWRTQKFFHLILSLHLYSSLSIFLFLSRSLSIHVYVYVCVLFHCWRCYCRNECISHKITLFLFSMHSRAVIGIYFTIQYYIMFVLYMFLGDIKYSTVNMVLSRLFWRSKVKTFGQCHLHKINDENGNPVVFCIKCTAAEAAVAAMGSRPLFVCVRNEIESVLCASVVEK